jgi:SAM-dependent methyltransferase
MDDHIDDRGSAPSADAEVERVRAVYARYYADPRTLGKWDPRNRGNALIREELNSSILALLAGGQVQLGEARILDVGCGSAGTLGWLSQCGAQETRLHGVDLREEQIELARTRYPQMHLSCADARALPFPDRFFDVIICNVLFSSILDETIAKLIAAELRRVLRPSGMIIWCDNRYGNPWNPNVRGYTPRAIRRLFPGCRIALRSITVVPPLVRRLGRWTSLLYPLLACVPVLRVKYLGTIQPEPWSG